MATDSKAQFFLQHEDDVDSSPHTLPPVPATPEKSDLDSHARGTSDDKEDLDHEKAPQAAATDSPRQRPTHDSDEGLPQVRRKPTQRAASSEGASRPWILVRLYSILPVWITSNLTWKSFKPVIRCSIAAWAGLLLLLCTKSHYAIGQACFLVLIVAFVSPPSAPVASTFHSSFLILIIVATSWAWACIGLRIAYIARTNKADTAQIARQYVQQNPSAASSPAEIQQGVLGLIFDGHFIEARSSVVCAIFYSVGCAIVMWIRTWVGPSPYVPGFIFAIILLSITLTYGQFFPYEYYKLGSVFYIPLAAQTAINLAACCLIFPETLAHKFIDNLRDSIIPLRDIFAQQSDVLGEDPTSDRWQSFGEGTKMKMAQVSTRLTLLAMSEDQLEREFSLKRLSGKDIRKLRDHASLMTARTSSLIMFFEVVARMHKNRNTEMDINQFIFRYMDPDKYHDGKTTDKTTTNKEKLGNSVEATDEKGGISSDRRLPPLRPQLLMTESATRIQTSSSSIRATSSRPQSVFTSHSRNPSVESLQDYAKNDHPQNDPDDVDDDDDDDDDDVAEVDKEVSSSSKKPKSAKFDPLTTTASHSHSPHSHSFSHSQSQKHHRHTRLSSKFGGSHHSIPSLWHDVFHPIAEVRPVGVHEAQRYMVIENKLANPADRNSVSEVLDLVHEATQPLQDEVLRGLNHIVDLLIVIKKGSFRKMFQSTSEAWGKSVLESHDRLKALQDAIENYNKIRRIKMIDPFIPLFDPRQKLNPTTTTTATDTEKNEPSSTTDTDAQEPYPKEDEELSRRALFVGFHYEHALLFFASSVTDFLKRFTEIEDKRSRVRLWTPVHWFVSSWKDTFGKNEFLANDDDHDPDDIPGLVDSGVRRKHDPDHLPPEHFGHVIGYTLYRIKESMVSANMIWVYEVAILTCLTSLPAYLKSSAGFYYHQRGFWATIMAVLTFSRFVGETVINFISRVLGTFIGALMGMVIWYIGSGSGTGNAYGIAATCAVTFPLLMFYRIYYPLPISSILIVVSTMLVLGYSWNDTHYSPQSSNVGYGWDVAWRRFLLVLIGVTAAFLWSFMPPRSTHKVALRKIYCRSTEEIGDMFCQLLTFANTGHNVGRITVPRRLFKNWTAIRTRLRSSAVRKSFVNFEISIRGRWPKETYETISQLLLEILDLIAQLANLLANMDAEWTREFLRRCRFDDPVFLGEVTSLFSMLSSSMKTGAPLPKFHTPLAEHFYAELYSLEHSDNPSLPNQVDTEVLKSEAFQRFSVAVNFASSIIIRLDRLTFAVKSLVGESYDISGLKEDEEIELLRRSSLESEV